MWVYIDVQPELFKQALTTLIDQGQIVVRNSDEDAIILTDNLIIASQSNRSLLLIDDKGDGRIEAIGALRGRLGGVITTEASKEELVFALESIDNGNKYLSPALTEIVFNVRGGVPRTNGNETPTPREIDVLRFIARGYTNRQTAGALYISTRTVESHRYNLMHKLNFNSRVELVRYARENGYVE